MARRVVAGIALTVIGLSTLTTLGAASATTLRQSQLIVSNLAEDDSFGSAIATSGDIVAVSAPFHKVGSADGAGQVYLFRQPTTGWRTTTPFAVISEPTPAPNDGFGESVVLTNNELYVGSYYTNNSEGAVYIYRKPVNGWATTSHPEATLTLANPVAGDHLGLSMALSGRTLAVGAFGRSSSKGAVEVFTEPPNGWVNEHETAELTSASSATGDDFGSTVAIAGNVIVAGSWIHNPAGEAVLFVKPNGGWVSATQTKRFTAASLGAGDEFGFDVEITADTVAIGAPLHAAPAANTGGAVFIYNKPTGGWGAPGPALMPAATLSEPATATSNDYFGVALSLRGPLLVVGAFAQSDGVPNAAQGEVFTFQRPAGGWANATASHGLVASDGQLKDRLGYIVATNGHAIFAQASSKNSSAGAVYVFAPPGPTLTNVTQSHRRWRVGTKAPRINAKHHPHGGTTFSFSVSQPAAAKLHFSANGRSKGSLTFAAKAGRNTVWFDGIISTHHKLKPGRATVTVSAANANGTPPARTLHFRVKRRPHHH